MAISQSREGAGAWVPNCHMNLVPTRLKFSPADRRALGLAIAQLL
jgi:hypothetical protein